MKHKGTITKILLLALCLVLALSAFTACGNEEAIQNLQNEVDQNKNKLDETIGKLDNLTNNAETKATVAALRALVEEVKATADGAATAAKLEELATSLSATATDAAATAAALAETKTALEAMIADGDSSLTANVATVLAKVEALEAAAATKAEFEAKVAELEAAIALKADDAVVGAALDALKDAVAKNAETDASVKAALEAAIKAVSDKVDGEVADALAELAEDIAKNAVNDATVKAALEAAIADANGDIADLLDAKAALEAALNENSANDATVKAALQAAIKAVSDKVDGEVADALDQLFVLADENAANDATVKAALEAAIKAVSDKVDGEVADKLAALEAAINANGAADATVKGLLDEVVADVDELMSNVDTLFDTVELLAKTVAANADATSEVAATFTEALTELAAIVDKKADAADVEEKVAALNDAMKAFATKTALNDAIADVQADCADLVSALEAAVEAKIEKLNADYAKVAADITALDGRTDVAEADIAELKAQLAAVAGKVDSLESNKDQFVDDYKAATDLLMDPTSEYSLKAFRDLYEEYVDAEAMYMADQYKEFMANLDVVEFYLVRATSVAEIEQLFDVKIAELEDWIDDFMWKDHFPALLESLKGTLTPDTDLDWVAEIYAVLPAEVKDANLDEYTNLFDAKAILDVAAIAADALDEAIAELAAETVIYLETAPYVEALCDLLDAIQAETFDDTALNLPEVYAYFLVDMNATDLLAEHDALLGMIARIEELDEAFAAMPEIIDVIADYDIARPLYTDFDAIDANFAEVEKWVADYTLETENALAMINAAGVYDAYANLEDAWYYAAAMKNIYDNYVAGFVSGEFEGLNETIAALIEANATKTLVLSKHDAAAAAARVAIDTVANDIAGTYQYDATIDGNFEAMITADLVEFAKIEDRLFGLKALKTYIDGLVESVKDLTFTVKYDDITKYGQLEEFRSKLDAAYDVYAITVDDANYEELASVAEARYAELLAAYKALVADILVVYEDAMDYLGDGNLPLKEGNNIITVAVKLGDLVKGGVTVVDLVLDEVGAVKVNLNDLYDAFIETVKKFSEKAVVAQSTAAGLTAVLAGLPTDTADLKNVDEYDAAVEAVIEWLNAYVLADEIDIADFIDAYDTIYAELEAIIEIEIFDDNTTKDLYVFLSVASFETLYNAYVALGETFANAGAEAPSVIESLETIIPGKWNIHTDFATSLNAYNDFVAAYYAHTLTAEADYFGVLAAFDAFDTEYQKYVAAVAAAQVEANGFRLLLAGLPVGAIDMSVAADYVDDVADAKAQLAYYYSITNCEDGCGCFTDAELLALAMVDARVEYSKAYYAVYLVADDTTKVKLEIAKSLYDSTMNTAADKKQVENIKAAALAKLATFVPAP